MLPQIKYFLKNYITHICTTVQGSINSLYCQRNFFFLSFFKLYVKPRQKHLDPMKDCIIWKILKSSQLLEFVWFSWFLWSITLSFFKKKKKIPKTYHWRKSNFYCWLSRCVLMDVSLLVKSIACLVLRKNLSCFTVKI